jgi:hypothetical protein
MKNLEQQILLFTNSLSLPIAKEYLYKTVRQHSEYPALTACTDTLDELGILYEALVIDRDHLYHISYPILIHTNNNGGELLYVKDNTIFTQQFLEQWDGIAITATDAGFRNNEENKKAYKTQREKEQLKFFGLSVILTLFIMGLATVSYQGHYFNILFSLLSLTGLTISYLIVQKEMGVANDFTEKLCEATKETDCNKVINSQGASLIGTLKWSDAGIIYFSATLLSSMIINILDASIAVAHQYLALAAIPFIMLSLYYQWRIVKKWCTLCLFTIVVLCLQAASCMIEPYLFTDMHAVFKSSLVVTLCLSFTFFIWQLLLKPSFIEIQQHNQNVSSLKRFKLQTDIFVQQLQKEAPLLVPDHHLHLQLANKDATLQLTVVCNPYCRPCATVHQQLHEMLSYASENIGLRVVFSMDPRKTEEPKNKIIQLLYNTIAHYGGLEKNIVVREVVHLWFEHPEEATFLNAINKSHILKQQCQKPDLSAHVVFEADMGNVKGTWTDQIKYTPTLLINGYKLPQLYTVEEFTKMVLPLINDQNIIIQLKNKILA